MCKHLLRYYRQNKLAVSLSIAGLTLALTSFVVIVAQVSYELTFDAHYENADRIFRAEYTDSSLDGLYESYFNRLLGDQMLASSPHIVKGGMLQAGEESTVYDEQIGKTRSVRSVFYRVSPSLPDVFEFEALRGDLGRIDRRNAVALSRNVAVALYGEDDPIGRRVVLQDEPYEVIAVYRDFPKNSSLASCGMIGTLGDIDVDNSGRWATQYYIRMDDTSHLESIRTRFDQICYEAYRDETMKTRFTALPRTHFTRDMLYVHQKTASYSTVYSLLAAAVLIVLIAAINFVNFTVSRIPSRIRYINTRKIFGETNATLRLKTMAEATVVAILSLALSLLIVQGLSLTRVASLVDAPISPVSNPRIVLYGLLAALGAGIMAGIYPAFYTTSFEPALALKGSFGLSLKGKILRTSLISFQYVVSIVLIVTSIAVVAQNRYMRNFDMGFVRTNVLTSTLPLHFNRQTALAEKLQKHPAVTDVTFADGKPVRDSWGYWGPMYKGRQIRFDCYNVGFNYLRFMGIPLRDGRDFSETDRYRREGCFIFNRAAQLQADVTLGDRISGVETVGIAEDMHYQPLQYSVNPMAYYVRPESVLPFMMIKVETADIEEVSAFIRETIRSFDPDANTDIRFLDEHIGALYQKEDRLAAMLTLFSLLSVGISIVGVFGLILFETQFRRKEIGLRKVYGATIGEILHMFNKRYMRIVLACSVVAIPIGWYVVDRWLESFAYRTPVRWWIFAVAVGSVALVTVLTITLQSYRTAAENPVRSIKTE